MEDGTDCSGPRLVHLEGVDELAVQELPVAVRTDRKRKVQRGRVPRVEGESAGPAIELSSPFFFVHFVSPGSYSERSFRNAP